MQLRSLLLVGSLLLSTFTFAQSTINTKKVIKGKIEMKTLTNDAETAWFYAGVNKYQPNENMLNYVKDNRGKFNVVAIVGTWDEESRRLLPALYKVIILAGSPEEQIITWGVDEKLQSDAPTDYKVKKVPTFIVFREGKELGRITGETKEPVESALAMILLKANKKDKE
jgi:hypothetical protein